MFWVTSARKRSGSISLSRDRGQGIEKRTLAVRVDVPPDWRRLIAVAVVARSRVEVAHEACSLMAAVRLFRG
jgi:hypothetical protein